MCIRDSFRKVEYMLILQGRMHATFQKHDDSEAVIEEIWEKGDLVRTLPGCVHTLTALGAVSYTHLCRSSSGNAG